jgi:2-keto-myo-inositol isomerase
MLNRRQLLKLAGLSSAAALLPFKQTAASTLLNEPFQPAGNAEGTFNNNVNPAASQAASPVEPAAARFAYCLNMATLRGHKLGFIKELEVASAAGFRNVEIWVESLQQYLQQGGTVKDASSRFNALGITPVNSIGFAKWIVDDDAVRAQGIEQLKREMDLLAQIGCKRLAAPPMGATDKAGLDLHKAAERYRTILELGDNSGVVPHLELWGFSKNLSRTSEVMFVALETGHSSARVLLDVYHLYKGGSSIETLPLIGKNTVEIIHVNDYPSISPDKIIDSDRVHPGDGIAPVRKILDILNSAQRPLIISEEVFNAGYYKQDALVVAKSAMAKMKAVTA